MTVEFATPLGALSHVMAAPAVEISGRRTLADPTSRQARIEPAYRGFDVLEIPLQDPVPTYTKGVLNLNEQ